MCSENSKTREVGRLIVVLLWRRLWIFVFRHDNHWQNSPFWTTAFLRMVFTSLDFVTISFYRARSSALRPTPILENQVSIYVPQWQGGPVIPPSAGFPSLRLLRVAGLRWWYSNPPPDEGFPVSQQDISVSVKYCVSLNIRRPRIQGHPYFFNEKIIVS
jgi:hypothetical protein